MSDARKPPDRDTAEAAQRRSRIIIAIAVIVLLAVAVSVYFSMGAGLRA